MSELEKLLSELIPRKGKDRSKKSTLPNTKEVWSKIGKGSILSEIGADFDLDKWMIDNPYENIAE